MVGERGEEYPLSLTPRHVLGIDLGGSSAKMLALDAEGRELWRSVREFPEHEAGRWLEEIRQGLVEVASHLGEAPCGIGVSAPGLASRDESSIACMPGRLQGLVGLNWRTALEMPFPVPVLNDGHAALLGEAWQGAGEGCLNLAMLTLGTGVGGAAMVNGNLLRGHIGRAGHLGHLSLDPAGPPDICGTPGSLELAVGNCSIRERTGGRFQSTHELIAFCQSGGDAAAWEVWNTSMRALAAGICSIINILDPEAVIIGGGIARAGDLMWSPLERHLEEMEWRPTGSRVRLLPARLGHLAGAFGAARRAWQSLAPHP